MALTKKQKKSRRKYRALVKEIRTRQDRIAPGLRIALRDSAEWTGEWRRAVEAKRAENLGKLP